jgi:hypothetical protein
MEKYKQKKLRIMKWGSCQTMDMLKRSWLIPFGPSPGTNKTDECCADDGSDESENLAELSCG